MNPPSNPARFQAAIEDALHEHWATALASSPEEMRRMIAYHMGWEESQAGSERRGKRLRPMLLLMIVEAFGRDWIQALPAAVAVEYLHNFSLIHDDIQDQSTHRHGREAVWTRWGIPQAINTGDAMFSLSYLALLNAIQENPAEVVVNMLEAFSQVCLALTQGQHLDMLYETRDRISEGEYLTMITGKTAALLGGCARLGAILGRQPIKDQLAMEQFGINLGLAFQIQDDILGIWGDPADTGKSIVTDLSSGKKTLPILHALNHSQDFNKAWLEDHDTPAGISRLLDLFEGTGSRAHAQSLLKEYTAKSIEFLHQAFNANIPSCKPLENMAIQLVERQK